MLEVINHSLTCYTVINMDMQKLIRETFLLKLTHTHPNNSPFTQLLFFPSHFVLPVCFLPSYATPLRKMD